MLLKKVGSETKNNLVSFNVYREGVLTFFQLGRGNDNPRVSVNGECPIPLPVIDRAISQVPADSGCVPHNHRPLACPIRRAVRLTRERFFTPRDGPGDFDLLIPVHRCKKDDLLNLLPLRVNLSALVEFHTTGVHPAGEDHAPVVLNSDSLVLQFDESRSIRRNGGDALLLRE